MKNCATCKFMNFRCKGNCGDCVNKVADKTFPIPTPPRHVPEYGSFAYDDGVYYEEKCKCIECYDEDSGKYKYWEADAKLVEYFSK